jgi:hypothetical protein
MILPVCLHCAGGGVELGVGIILPAQAAVKNTSDEEMGRSNYGNGGSAIESLTAGLLGWIMARSLTAEFLSPGGRARPELRSDRRMIL